MTVGGIKSVDTKDVKEQPNVSLYSIINQIMIFQR